MEANSTPTAPAPTIASDFGTAERFRISTLVRMRSASGSRPGNMRASDPVGDDHVARFKGPHAIVGLDLDLARPGQFAIALDPVHLVLLHQELDALGVLGNDLILALDELGKVQARVVAQDSLLLPVRELLPEGGGVQQGLGGDAADVQAGAAELGVLLDQGGLEAVLPGPHRGGIAARPAANDDKVVAHRPHVSIGPGFVSAAGPRAGSSAAARQKA